MNEPARYDDQGAWVPDDEANAMRGIVTGVCISSCIWIVLGAIAWGLWK